MTGTCNVCAPADADAKTKAAIPRALAKRMALPVRLVTARFPSRQECARWAAPQEVPPTSDVHEIARLVVVSGAEGADADPVVSQHRRVVADRPLWLGFGRQDSDRAPSAA
jgi:hypothetical protein